MDAIENRSEERVAAFGHAHVYEIRVCGFYALTEEGLYGYNTQSIRCVVLLIQLIDVNIVVGNKRIGNR